MDIHWLFKQVGAAEYRAKHQGFSVGIHRFLYMCVYIYVCIYIYIDTEREVTFSVSLSWVLFRTESPLAVRLHD